MLRRDVFRVNLVKKTSIRFFSITYFFAQAKIMLFYKNAIISKTRALSSYPRMLITYVCKIKRIRSMSLTLNYAKVVCNICLNTKSDCCTYEKNDLNEN